MDFCPDDGCQPHHDGCAAHSPCPPVSLPTPPEYHTSASLTKQIPPAEKSSVIHHPLSSQQLTNAYNMLPPLVPCRNVRAADSVIPATSTVMTCQQLNQSYNALPPLHPVHQIHHHQPVTTADANMQTAILCGNNDPLHSPLLIQHPSTHGFRAFPPPGPPPPHAQIVWHAANRCDGEFLTFLSSH
jgi:hypothetical protein